MDNCLLECCMSADQIKSRRINKQIRRSKSRDKTVIKILLLGTGESGKSTFLRQMRIIYDNGFPEEERLEYIAAIQKIIFLSMQSMVEAMQRLKIVYEHESNSENADIIKSVDVEGKLLLSDIYVTALKALWQDAGIQECYQRRGEYHLDDCIKYYMQHIERIAEDDYIPSETDIVNVRIPTTGLIEYCFNMQKCDFRMIDVGGQRSERKKWLHCFNTVKAVLFLIAISEYDQILRETNQNSRLEESKQLFQSICKCEWFTESSLVVFFNKTDLLMEKIMYSDLCNFYPAYTGPREDYESAKTFISKMFLEASTDRQLYHHFTCATDTENIKVIFAIVRDTILNTYLKDIML